MKHIRPLCWLLLGVFGGIILYWNIWSWQFIMAPMELHVLFTVFMLLHVGLYCIALSVAMSRRYQWLLLFTQAALILLFTQLTQLVLLTLMLSLVLFVIATLMLNHVRSLLIAIGCYVVLLLFYMNTVGPVQGWQAMWNGGYAPEVAILGLFFLIVLMLYLHREQKAHEQTRVLLHELDVAHAQLSAYALHVEELTMTTERQRIARDLHDTLVQGVTGMIMQLDVACTQLRQQKFGRAQEIMEQVMESARDTVVDARCAIGDLRSECVRPDDLIEVVQEEMSRFTATTEIPCQSDLTLLTTVPAALCEHVVRVISEGLANTAQHASAHMVVVRVVGDDGMLIIEVQDDGVGFDTRAVSTQIGHYGLLGMRERAKLVGGKLEITSELGKGTILRFHFPASILLRQEGEVSWVSTSV